MREIKFRVWNVEDSAMICWQDLVASDFVMYDFSRDKDFMTWMQYTGLKDKNGREIYEDDILMVTDKMVTTSETNMVKGVYPKGCKFKVRFNDGRFQIYKSKRKRKSLLHSKVIRQNGLEVIGNIHEKI